jgi:hypothetical protein
LQIFATIFSLFATLSPKRQKKCATSCHVRPFFVALDCKESLQGVKARWAARHRAAHERNVMGITQRKKRANRDKVDPRIADIEAVLGIREADIPNTKAIFLRLYTRDDVIDFLAFQARTRKLKDTEAAATLMRDGLQVQNELEEMRKKISARQAKRHLPESLTA